MTPTERAEVAKMNEEEIKEILPEFQDKDFEDLKLSPNQLLFAYEYVLQEFDATAAYEVVYGSKDRTYCRMQGNKLLKNPNVVTAFNRICDMIWKQSQLMLPLKIMKELNIISGFDPADYYYDDFKPKPLSSIPVEKRRLINNITLTVDKFGIAHHTYELPSKTKVTSILLELLKIKGMTKEEDTGLGNDSEAKALRDSIFGGKE